MTPNEPDYKNLFLAVLFAAALLMGWQAFVELPRRQQLAQMAANDAKREEEKKQSIERSLIAETADPASTKLLTRTEQLATSPRVKIASGTLHGSISLKGARMDDLTLAKYRVSARKDSPEVVLLSPQGMPDAYFAEAGWVADDGKTAVPDSSSLWSADRKELTPGTPVTLRWENGQGITFSIVVTLDEDYMFTLRQRVENRSQRDITLRAYAFLNRIYEAPAQGNPILHEGPVGVFSGVLNEAAYKDLHDKDRQSFKNTQGWLGISDKYWLAAIIPGEKDVDVNFSHYQSRNLPRFQVDYLAPGDRIAAGQTLEKTVRIFAGAKEIKALERYTTGDAQNDLPPIPLFDRAVDFGSLYFLTKPMFLMLNFFYAHIGNFGLAIMLLTVAVKLLMFPLANKSYRASTQLREIQPEMAKLKDRYGEDRIKFNQELMALYKREKVNPAAGCMPVLIQMPVFFALYKVLYVTLEMRHAPFFGWLTDLSASDPSNFFTLFGLLPWTPPSFLHIGVLPALFCASMVIQMKQQPKPTDPVQAKIMTFLPYFFLLLFNSFPAGLVLYWTWSNVLSIFQQMLITARYKAHKSGKIVDGGP